MDLIDTIKRCQEHDRESLRLLFNLYIGMVSAYFGKQNIPYEDLKRLCSEVFTHVWNLIDRFKIDPSYSCAEVRKHFVNWIHRIAKWKAGAYFKQREFGPKTVPLDSVSGSPVENISLEEMLASSAPDPEQQFLSSEKSAQILTMLGILPRDEQEIIRLRFLESFTYSEILEVTGEKVEVSVIRKRCERALKKLKEFLITSALDQLLTINRNGNEITIQEFLDNLVLDSEYSAVMKPALEEESMWLDWFATHKDDLKRNGYCNRQKKHHYIWQHFVKRRTYGEIAGSSLAAHKVRKTIQIGLRQINKEKYNGFKKR